VTTRPGKIDHGEILVVDDNTTNDSDLALHSIKSQGLFLNSLLGNEND